MNYWWMIYVLFSKVLLEGRGAKWIGNSSVYLLREANFVAEILAEILASNKSTPCRIASLAFSNI